MESSHSHNTGMAKIVHGMYDEYFPTQTETNGVRTTIDGFPIALFYKENANAPIQYFGIYNFNDDKDNTDTFGYTTGTECWEVCNNTSQRTLFRLSDYEIIGTDGNPEWYADFEARYPDKNRDYTNLKRLTDWIVSTDGDLDKFKNEFEQYFNLHYTLIYCVLTEMFAMVDSRAKNMFLASWDKTIWYPVFYDMDTIFGLNNEGELIFEYNVETNDTIGTQNVYNGKNSLLWQNFEQAFADEIKETYNSLRDSDKLTYEKVLSILEGEQIDILCEAQYNEDAKYKYLDPLLNENIATYLYIAQGSRENHLKYWLFNRFNYMDSKYIASDYKDNYATMRLYTPENWSQVRPNPNFTITPFANQYSTVKFGSYVVSERSEADTPKTVVAPNIEFNDTETIIYGANRISSLGDLSDKYAGTVDMSKATQLTELIIGSDKQGYTNANLKTVSVGNNKLLRKIDVRNCPSLTAPLDLSQCDNIQEVYATGTSITSIKFSEGTELTTLAIPNTLTNLTLINKTKLTNITSEGYDNLNTLRIENSAINPFSIINSCTELESVRLIGLNCQTNVTNLQRLATLKGINENSVEIPISDAISGNITITECSQELLDELKIVFPNVTFKVLTYSTSWNVTFVDGDGNTIYETKVLNNGEAIYLGNTPTKTSTAQYDYTWKGWDRQLKPIMSDCVINATFNSVLRYYTVKFVNGETLEVIQELVLGYGATITQPALPDGANAWTPVQTTVIGDITFTSKYIPYPDDLSIFSFTSTFINNQLGYICSLKSASSYPSLVIVPFHYKNKPVFSFKQDSTSSNYPYSDIKEVYLPETVEILSSSAFARWGISSIDLSNIKYLVDLDRNENNTPPFGKNSIVNNLFCQCRSIKNVSLPKIQFLPQVGSEGMFYNSTLEVITIGSEEYPFEEWRDYPSNYVSSKHFGGCSNLKIVNLITKNGLESDVNFINQPSSTVKSKIIYSKTPIEIGEKDNFNYYIHNNETIITSYTGTDTSVEIPSTINGKTVSKLSDKVFYNNGTIIEVTIPDSVTTIGDFCFNNCTALTTVRGMQNVTTIGDYCFYRASSSASKITTIGNVDGEMNLPKLRTVGTNFLYYSSFTNDIILPELETADICLFYTAKFNSLRLPRMTQVPCDMLEYCESKYIVVGSEAYYVNRINVSDTSNMYCSFYGVSCPVCLVSNVDTLDELHWSDKCSSYYNYYRVDNNNTTSYNNIYNNWITGLYLSKKDVEFRTTDKFDLLCGDKNILLGLNSNYLTETEVTISDELNIYAIAPGAFRRNTTITTMYISNSVEKLDVCSFERAKIVNITGCENVKYLSSYCFYNCTELSSVNGKNGEFSFPNIEVIASNVFTGNNYLTSFIGKPKIVDNSAFYNCQYLKNIDLSECVKLGYAAFYYCRIQVVYAPKLQSFDCYTFYTTVYIKVFIVGSKEYPLKEIDNTNKCYASTSCKIYFVTENGLRDDLTLSKPGNSIFNYEECENNINFVSENASVVESDGIQALIYDNEATVVSVTDKYLSGDVVLDEIDGVPITKLAVSYASNYSIKNISLPNVTSLSNNCFYNCYNLTSISLPNVTSLGDSCFYGCNKLASIEIPNVTSLGNNCFSSCEALTSIEIPLVTSLGEYCFSNCKALTSISLPNVTSIGNNCFYYCDTLTSISLPNVTSLGNSCFNSCKALTSIEIPLVTSLGDSCFYYCKTLTSIEIPNVTSLGDSCFNNCLNLTSISLPNVTSLGKSCFYYCKALTSISLPNVTSLGSQCFDSCKTLTSISLPNVTSLGSYCFSSCEALTSISLPSVTSLGSQCFYNCFKLTSVTLGELNKPITNTDNFNSTALISYIKTLDIYVENASNPPTLIGSPWGATNATISYKQA